MSRTRLGYNLRFLKTIKGTPEHLWEKWYKKLWIAHGVYADSKLGEPPSQMKDEFIRDLFVVLENELVKIAPEKSILPEREIPRYKKK